MAAEVTSFTEEDKIIQWLFEHACKFKLYDIIHEILKNYPKVSELSHIRLALAAISKIVAEEDVENFDLAVTLIEEIHYFSRIKVYKQLTESLKSNVQTDTFKKALKDFVDVLEMKLPLRNVQQPKESTPMRILQDCLRTDQEVGSHDALLDLVKLLCVRTRQEEMSDSSQSRPSCSYSVLTGRPVETPHTSTVEGNQIYTISSSSDSGPLRGDDTNRLTLSGLTDPHLQHGSQECVMETDSLDNSLHIQEYSLALSSDEEKVSVQGIMNSSIEDIFVPSTDEETSSPELFPNIKVSKKFEELCLVKLHKDNELSRSINDPRTNKPVDIFT